MSVEDIKIAPRIAAAPRTMLKPSSWMNIIDFIQRLILDKKSLISLVGEQGSGKTTFIDLLQKELSPQIESCVITAESNFDRTVFLKQLTASIDVEGDLSIANFIARSNKQKTHTLLIIDNVHYLPIAFIEEILNELQTQEEDARFHVCLVVSASLTTTLNKLIQEKYPHMLHSIELGALTEEETKIYVEQNIQSRAGVEKVITHERIKQFYELTDGRLEKIDRHMSDFFSRKPKKSVYIGRFLRYLGAAIGIFIAAVGVVYLWLSPDFQSAPVHIVSLGSPVENNIQIEPALESTIPSYTVAAKRQIPEIAALRKLDFDPSDDFDEEINSSFEPVMDKVVVAPKILPHVDKEEANVADQEAELTVAPTVAIEKVEAKPKPIVNANSIKLAAPQDLYTIQIVASHNQTTLQRFAKEHHIMGKTKIRRFKRQGAVWYVLTLGEYPNKEDAKQAVNQLSREIGQFKPWIRLLSDLKTTG
jgi:DamX protein